LHPAEKGLHNGWRAWYITSSVGVFRCPADVGLPKDLIDPAGWHKAAMDNAEIGFG